MTYSETIKYLYAQHPAFERQGGDAYKPGLQTSIDLAELFQNPQNKYKHSCAGLMAKARFLIS